MMEMRLGGTTHLKQLNFSNLFIKQDFKMKLEEMYPNYLFLPLEGQIAFIASYRLRRMEDMANVPQERTRKVKETSKIDILTDDEKKVLKKMGISLKDYSGLRAVENGEEDDSPENYFRDDSFDLESEEE